MTTVATTDYFSTFLKSISRASRSRFAGKCRQIVDNRLMVRHKFCPTISGNNKTPTADETGWLTNIYFSMDTNINLQENVGQ